MALFVFIDDPDHPAISSWPTDMLFSNSTFQACIALAVVQYQKDITASSHELQLSVAQKRYG